MRLVNGPGGLRPGTGLKVTFNSVRMVVWLPLWKPAAYTRCPSGVTARARRVGIQRDDGQRRTAQRRAQVLSVKDPDIGSPHSGRGELRVIRHVLPPVCRSDKSSAVSRPGEDDITRLIAHQQGADDAAGVSTRVNGDHADAIREVVHDPDLRGTAGCHRHRLQAHGDRGTVRQAVARDREDFEPIIWRVDGKELVAARGQSEEAHLATFKRVKAGGAAHAREVSAIPKSPRALLSRAVHRGCDVRGDACTGLLLLV